MKVLIVNYSDLNVAPPTRMLLDVLLDLGVSVVLISRDTENALPPYAEKGVETYRIPDFSNNRVNRVFSYLKFRKWIRSLVPKLLKDCDLIWAATDRSAVELGYKILSSKPYVLQLLELTNDIPEYPRQKMIKANLRKYGLNATKVVVPEYNRACIFKTWWGLNSQPIVLPNKPYRLPELEIELSESILKMKNDDRKKVLYQGIFGPDRDLDIIASAVDKMPGYVLYLMGRENEYSKRLLSMHPSIEFLGYCAPPNHIVASRYADVGLLPYKPTKDVENYSELNALYCAPNKIYEYASQNLPMVGSNVPGLVFPFKTYGIGEPYDDNSIESIITSISTVCENKERYQFNCGAYYNSVDLKEIVQSIIK